MTWNVQLLVHWPVRCMLKKGLLYVITMKYKMRGKKEFYKHTEKKITLRIERWYDISIILVLTMCVCMCVCVCVCFQ